MTFETTAVRLWKHLAREDRLKAADAFWKEPPTEALGIALVALVKARRIRPQVARALPEDEKVRALAALHDPGEPLAASLLVSLHLGARRALLAAFLDALGLPHENGILKDEAETVPPPSREALEAAAAKLKDFPKDEVSTYFNTLYLQDPDRWGLLETVTF